MKHLIFMRDTFPSLDADMQYLYLERIRILTDKDVKELPMDKVPDEAHEEAVKEVVLFLCVRLPGEACSSLP